MEFKISRRHLVKGIALSGITAAIAGRASMATAAEPLGIALIIPSPVADVWLGPCPGSRPGANQGCLWRQGQGHDH